MQFNTVPIPNLSNLATRCASYLQCSALRNIALHEHIHQLQGVSPDTRRIVHVRHLSGNPLSLRSSHFVLVGATSVDLVVLHAETLGSLRVKLARPLILDIQYHILHLSREPVSSHSGPKRIVSQICKLSLESSASTIAEVTLYDWSNLTLAISNSLEVALELLLIVILVLSCFEGCSIDCDLLKAPPVALVASIVPAHDIVAIISVELIAIA